MKRKNREINIFSMSALDLFASAMGAFLLIAVMALPYYLKTDNNLTEELLELKKKIEKIAIELEVSKEENKSLKEKITKAKSQNEEIKKQLEETKKIKTKLKKCKEKNIKLQEEATKMQQKLSKTFCVIQMAWSASSGQDVDLYVTDPNGNTYYWKKHSYDDSGTSLTVDAGHPVMTKDGAEVWVSKELIKGTYTIKYRLPKGTSTYVTGSVFTKSFTKDLPKKYLSKGKSVKVAKIRVDANGNASLQNY